MTHTDELANVAKAIEALTAYKAALELPKSDNPNTDYLRAVERDWRWLNACDACDALFDGDVAGHLEAARLECGVDDEGNTLDSDGFPRFEGGFDGNPSLGRAA